MKMYLIQSIELVGRDAYVLKSNFLVFITFNDDVVKFSLLRFLPG